MNALAKALRRCTLWLTAIIPSLPQSESSLIFLPGIGQSLMLGTVVAGPAATARMAMAEEIGFGQAVEIRPDRDRGPQNLFDN